METNRVKSFLKPAKELRAGFKDPVRMSRIHDFPCALCYLKGWKQQSRTTAHHKHGAGLGKKVSDKLSMGLCDEHHQKGPNAFHVMGRVAWEEKFEVTQNDLILLTDKMLENGL